jgi:hypothetical protein
MAGCTGQRHIAKLMTYPFRGAILALALLSAACDLETTPPEPQILIDVSVDFCADEIPIWVAYQNVGTPWVQLTPDAAGTVSFTAENRVALAFVHQNGADSRVEMIFTTNNVLEKISGIACLEESGSKTLNGSVAGFSGSQLALVGLSYSSVYRTPSQTAFTLANLPTRALDIMASRMNIIGTTQQHADRTILRRSQNLVSGGTIPVLDFSASEAVTPVSPTAVVSGVLGTDAAFVTSNFTSQLGTSHLLSYVEGITNGNVTFEALPAASLAAGDFHDVFVTAVSTVDGVRGAERLFRTPANQALALGPALSEPNVATISGTPYRRLRTTLAGQTAYPSAVSLAFDQQLQFSATQWFITVTSGYFGGLPFTWDLTIPDLSSVSGWQNAWGLQNGAVGVTATAHGVRGELLFGAPPKEEGETTVYATRTALGTTSPYVAGAVLRPPQSLLRRQQR